MSMTIAVLVCILPFAILCQDDILKQPAVAQRALLEEDSALGNCDCGAFISDTTSPTDKPLLVVSPLNVTCNEVGTEECSKYCSEKATEAKHLLPAILCASIEHADHLKPYLHTRVCDSTEWKYEDLSYKDDICCHNHTKVDCKEEVKV